MAKRQTHFHISHNRLISLTEINGLNTEQTVLCHYLVCVCVCMEKLFYQIIIALVKYYWIFYGHCNTRVTKYDINKFWTENSREKYIQMNKQNKKMFSAFIGCNGASDVYLPL